MGATVTNVRFGEPAWIDTILTRIGDRLVDTPAVGLAADLIFVYEGEPTDLLSKPPADRFLVLAPVRLPVSQGPVIGGGAAHTVFEGQFRVDVFRRVGGDREFRSFRSLTQAEGLSPFVQDVITALQLEPLTLTSLGITTTPLTQPMRLVSADFNPRKPQAGWSWCRTMWLIPFRTSFARG